MDIWEYRVAKLFWMDAQVRKLEDDDILNVWLIVVPDLTVREEAEEIAHDAQKYRDVCVTFSNCLYSAS